MKAAVVLALLTLIGCNAPQEPAPAPATSAPPTTEPPTTAPPTSAPPTSAPPAAAPPTTAPAERKNISIDAVEVANPLVISGHARTFENNVVLRVRDARGVVMRETSTISTGEMGQHNPYRASLWLTRDPGRRVIVEALDYSAKDGSERDLVRVEKPFAVETIEVRLYFPDENCNGVKPSTRRLPKSISLARLLVEALLAEKKGAFPEGSAVQSVNLRNGTLTVDFNERLRNVGGSCRAQMIRAAVTETLLQLPSVKRVVITAAGSEALALQP